MPDRILRLFGLCAMVGLAGAVPRPPTGGQECSVPPRFTAVWAKRPSGLEFVSWQSSGIPGKQ